MSSNARGRRPTSAGPTSEKHPTTKRKQLSAVDGTGVADTTADAAPTDVLTWENWLERLADQLAERQARRHAREEFRRELAAARARGKAVGHARRLAHRGGGGRR